MKLPLYFDYAATTPVDPIVVKKMVESLSDFSYQANASSNHNLGSFAAQEINLAKEAVSFLLNCQSKEIIFTSGATESNNIALQGLSNYLHLKKTPNIISSSTEHKAVLDVLVKLKEKGHEITLLDPDTSGLINLNELEKTVSSKTGLISLMHANNETGTVQNIQRVGEICKKHEILFHVDAAQTVGKIPIDTHQSFIDLLSLSAHKFYGPKGIGALYIKNNLLKELSPIYLGGGQEQGIRPGTCANHQIIGLAKAAEISLKNLDSDYQHAEKVRSILLDGLDGLDFKLISNSHSSLPNILNISFTGVNATTLLTCLNEKAAISSGSACTSGTIEPSHVLKAMGLDSKVIDGAVRISFGRFTTVDEVKNLTSILKNEITRIKSLF